MTLYSACLLYTSIPSKGEIVRTDTAYQGEIVILPSDSVRLNDVLGAQTRLPRKRWREDPLPMLRTTIAPQKMCIRDRVKDNQPRPVLRDCLFYALVGEGKRPLGFINHKHAVKVGFGFYQDVYKRQI